MRRLPFGAPAHLKSLGQLVQALPARQLRLFWLAIFSTFSMLGFAFDVMTGGRQPLPLLVMNAIASGALSVLYAKASMPPRVLRYTAVLVFHILYSVFAPQAFRLLPAPPKYRFIIDGVGMILTVGAGYSFFLRFINVTASRYLRARAEIAVAHDIHQVLTPAIDRQAGGYEFLGHSLASGDVGGDLVDLVDEDGRWIAYVGDVSGHGVGPGVIMGMFKSAMRMRARRAGGIGPLLDDVHAVLMPLKAPATFITVACVQADGDRVECAVAGHLPILRVRRGTVEEVTEPQLALGMFADTRFDAQSVELRPGDLLALLTDGLVEVFDARNRELGLDWAKEVLAAAADQPLAAIADRLLSGARGHGPQLDDQTLLLIRRRVTTTPA